MMRTLIEELKDPDLSAYADPAKANAYLLCLCHDAHLALKELQAQPVAWVNQANLNSAAIERNRGGQGDTHTWSETPTWDHSVPLYTAPPPRQPLTDEEIDQIWMPHTIIQASDRQRHAFARAIEAAVLEKQK